MTPDAFLKDLPKTVRIGPHIYTIELATFAENKRVWGEFDADAHKIRLSHKMPTSERIAETVLHEVLHGIWGSWNIQKSSEEHAITCLAVGLACLVKYNPKLIAWLVKALK